MNLISENGLRETFLDATDMRDKKRILEETKLAEIDLLYHIGRIYLIGNNTPQDSWSIPKFPPFQIENLINSPRYMQFAINHSIPAHWKSSEVGLSVALTILFPPIGLMYYHKCKNKVAQRMRAKFALDQHDDFWKNMDEQLVTVFKRTKAIKLSYSKDLCLGYIDFLDFTRERDDYTGPALPLTLMWSGRGTYIYPYNININDPLLKSVVKLFHDQKAQNSVPEFYENLNLLVKKLSFYDFPSIIFRCMSAILELIHKANSTFLLNNKLQMFLYVYETPVKKGKQYNMEYKKKFPLNIKILKPQFEAILKALIEDLRIKCIRSTHDIKFAMVIDQHSGEADPKTPQVSDAEKQQFFGRMYTSSNKSDQGSSDSDNEMIYGQNDLEPLAFNKISKTHSGAGREKMVSDNLIGPRPKDDEYTVLLKQAREAHHRKLHQQTNSDLFRIVRHDESPAKKDEEEGEKKSEFYHFFAAPALLRDDEDGLYSNEADDDDDNELTYTSSILRHKEPVAKQREYETAINKNKTFYTVNASFKSQDYEYTENDLDPNEEEEDNYK